MITGPAALAFVLVAAAPVGGLPNFSATEHGGTHIDAPAHFAKDETVDAIPIERLVGPAGRRRHGKMQGRAMKIHGGSGGPLRAFAIVEER